MPALRTSGLGALFADAALAEGYRPFPLPAAILTAPYRGRHACTYCSFCSRFGCHVDAKASTQNTVLAELMASDRATIVTGARVTDVVTNASGRAIGVHYRDAAGETLFQAAGRLFSPPMPSRIRGYCCSRRRSAMRAASAMRRATSARIT